MGFGTCRRMWCGVCYNSPATPKFHVAVLNDNNGETDDEDRIKSGWKARKGDNLKFHTARDGDDLLVSFECDFCIFSKLYRRLSYEMEGSDTDEFAMACIRRVVLDFFWSRAKSIVSFNTYLLRSTMRFPSGLLGPVDGPYGNPGSDPDFGNCGNLVAMQMVAASLSQGRYSPSYKQWDTICRVKSVYSNHYRSTSKANSAIMSMVSNKGAGAQI